MFNLRGIESVLAGAHLGHWATRAKRKHKQTCTQLTSRCADQSSDLLLRSLLTAELHARTRVTLKVEINGRIKTKTNSHAASHWHITCQVSSVVIMEGSIGDVWMIVVLFIVCDLYTVHWRKSNACRTSIVWHQCYFCVYVTLVSRSVWVCEFTWDARLLVSG